LIERAGDLDQALPVILLSVFDPLHGIEKMAHSFKSHAAPSRAR
jgi:hypothetical protein